ncbi:PDC sensor domain-containing protein [Rhodopirellula sp. MGV]|uniref:PDC sensor domain-containing protein n=1 Tax=Rhodopirellula sp. MGV TaxID=2023130 RepID=UPI00117A4221|nr:PDC sensor domain-containing protein [Rhodopirellula sp. MGV]
MSLPVRGDNAFINMPDEIGEKETIQIAKHYAKDHLEPALRASETLVDELKKVNRDRAEWQPFSDRWKAWKPDEVELHQNSYDYAEYVWSARKDRRFRNHHLRSGLANELRRIAEESEGVISELFVVDALGGNVAVTSWTSDWFQGNEAKFIEPAKSLDIYVSASRRDDTVGKTVVQASVPVVDQDGALLGVAIVSLDVELLSLHN